MSQGVAAPSPLRTRPFPDLPVRFDGREAEYLLEALKRNNLFYHQPDGMVSRFVARAAEAFGAKHAIATSSGTASLHAAVGAAGVEAGAEVVLPPITDMGTAIAILYQNAVPVFCDVDPDTYNATPETIEAALTDRTRAVVVVHLAGAPCDLGPIADLCRRRGVKLIEDCAQALGATYRGRHVGSFGDLGCFSLNNFKHLSCGDGGVLVTNDDQLFHRGHNYADKCYDRHAAGDRLTYLAPNYRMTELQGAVALAQLDRLDAIAGRRRALGDALTEMLAGIPGIRPPVPAEGGASSYWFYMFRVEEAELGMSRGDFAARLNAEGIPAGAGYLAYPLYREPVFQNKAFFPGGVWPAEAVSGRSYDYRRTSCPHAEKVLATTIRLTIHEGYSEGDIEDYAAAVRKVAAG